MDPDYADFKEQLSEYVKAATETSHLAKNETSNTTSRNLTANTAAAVASKKKEIMRKPTNSHKVIHLRPGEYTGFKRSIIETGGITISQDIEPIKRFKSIGKVKDDDDEDKEKEDMGKKDEKEDEAEDSHARKNVTMQGVTEVSRNVKKTTPLIIQKTLGKITNNTAITSNQESKNKYLPIINSKKNVTMEREQKQPSEGYNHQGSGSGDSEDIRNIDLSKFLKAPITVSVHVTKQTEDSSEDASVKGEENEDERDPFGFTKENGKRRDTKSAGDADDVADPFGFNKLQQDQQDRKYFLTSKENSNKKTTFTWD